MQDGSREKTSLKRDRGSALISVLMMSLVLFAFIIAISILMNQRFHSINLKQAQSRAGYAAQAGITRALDKLSVEPTWNDGFGPTQLDGDSELTYQVEVSNRFSETDGAFAPDGTTWVPAGTIWVRSVGTMGDVSSGSVGLIGMVGQYRPTFDHAVFGDVSVDINETRIDSDVGGGADVGSNALGGPAIALSGAGTVVNGKALCAPTADPSDPGVISVSGGASVLGGAQAANETKVVLPFPNNSSPGLPGTNLELPDGANAYNLFPGDFGNVKIGRGCVVKLANPPGEPAVYHLSGDLTVTGGTIMVSNVNPDFPVTLYIKGDATITETSIVGLDSNTGAPVDPRCLQIYFTEDDPTTDASMMTMSQSDGHFVSAGDTVDYNFTGSTFTGGLIGRNVSLNACTVTYLEALKNVPLQGQGRMTILLQDDVPPAVAQQIAQTGNPPPPPPTTPPAPKPLNEPTDPVPARPDPVTNATEPVNASVEPAANQNAPATNAPAPTTVPVTTAPPAPTTVPVTTAPPASTTVPAPATIAPAPATIVPAPATVAPAPTSGPVPAPVAVAPAPISPAPVPVSPAPASITNPSVVPLPISLAPVENGSVVVPVPASITNGNGGSPATTNGGTSVQF